MPDQKPTPEHVYLLVAWDDRSDDVRCVTLTLGRAQEVHREVAYGTGRFDRKLPKKGLRWEEAVNQPGHWEPSDYDESGHGYYIERHEVDHGGTDGEATT